MGELSVDFLKAENHLLASIRVISREQSEVTGKQREKKDLNGNVYT